MGWAVWLRDLAAFGALAAALAAGLRTGPGRRAVAAVRAAVGAWSPTRALAIVLALTLGARLLTLPTFEPPWEADVREYVEKAERIADEGSPRRQEVQADGSVFHRPLGSSLALAGWYRVTGTRGLASARVHGILLAGVAAWLLLTLGRTVGRETDGRLAALAYAVFLPHVIFASIPYTETFTTVLVLAISVLHERARRDVAGWPAVAAIGLLGGWLAITRTELLWLAPLSVTLLAWEKRRDLAAALAPSAAAVVLFVVPLAVNHQMRDGYPGTLRTSVQGGLILYFGNNPIEVNGYGNATEPVQRAVRAMYEEDPTGRTARDAAVAWMRAHPFAVVANAPKKAFHLWLAEPQGFRWHAGAGRPPSGMERHVARALRSAAYAQSLLLLLLAVAGWRSLGGERRFWCWTLWLHLGVWCLLSASTRNRYPFEPWLLLAAVAGLRAADQNCRSNLSFGAGSRSIQ